MKVILFALTGFGNYILDSLYQKCDIISVFTRKEKGSYPYYPIENIVLNARNKNINIYEEFVWKDVLTIIDKEKPKLLLISTFHRIIPKKIYSKVPYSINLHPALLPTYRGPTPIRWAIKNEERITGVTAHFLNGGVDSGDIILQRKIKIKKNDTESTLRKKLSILSAKMAIKILKMAENDVIKSYLQDESLVTYFPKINYEDE